MVDPTQPLADVVERNIKILFEVRRQLQRKSGFAARFADAITAFCGSLTFITLHAVWFLAWMGWNLGLIGLTPFDPFPFGLLTMMVSLEAIFLSTFVLMSQNRMSSLADKRADLDLQVNLLAEYEITKILGIVDGIADHLGLREGEDPELEELKVKISPERMLREMEKLEQVHRRDVA